MAKARKPKKGPETTRSGHARPQATELTKAQVTELVVNALELHDGGNAHVVYDAKIPEIDTGSVRQVDIAVFSQASGRIFLRMVEIRDRGRKVGPEYIDQVQGKMRVIGAHRATIVASAGFTSTALDRMRRLPHELDAFDLRPGRQSEWPTKFKTNTIQLSDGSGQVESINLEHRRYRNALTEKLVYDVLYGTWVRARMVMCLLIPPDRPAVDAHEYTFNLIALDRGGDYQLKGASVSYYTDDEDGTRVAGVAEGNRRF